MGDGADPRGSLGARQSLRLFDARAYERPHVGVDALAGLGEWNKATSVPAGIEIPANMFRDAKDELWRNPSL